MIKQGHDGQPHLWSRPSRPATRLKPAPGAALGISAAPAQTWRTRPLAAVCCLYAELGIEPLFGRIVLIATRFGTERSEVQILSPRPTFLRNIRKLDRLWSAVIGRFRAQTLMLTLC